MDVRRRAIEEVEAGSSHADVARALGVSTASLGMWVKAYELAGDAGLEAPASTVRGRGRQSKPKGGTAAKKRADAVVATKKANPDFGTRRIRDLLRRFEAIGVTEGEVRRILHEAGLMGPPPRAARRPKPPKRFERARPNQMWQSDIFTFLLRRHERLYLTAFMDDHSRYLVSHALAHHQRSTLVLEALERGVADYGVPQEILTDQGRQYTAWRGVTAFEQRLKQYGIDHVKSRPQHPQTLGKVERFWKTLWMEFLSKTVFSDFADCQRRLELFIQAYNFQRPHQGIDGLVPADRYFQAAPHVREAIERNVETNARRMALERPPRKPFYLVGRLGDHDVSIAAQGDGLKVRVGDEAPQTIKLAESVADALATDFEANGAPLVLRLDRASSHRAPPVQAVADAYGVLLLHGPPHHPGFYGQLERQNREQRAWLRDAAPGLDELPDELERMVGALNGLWHRGTLGFRTAGELWDRRPPLTEDRAALREEVDEREERLRESGAPVGSALSSRRRAIEEVMIAHGYVRIETGGWC